MKSTFIKFTAPLAVAVCGLISGPSAFAASGNWTNDATSVWSAVTNWNPNAVPGTAAGDVVSLTNNITAAQSITLDTAATVGALNIGDSGSAYFAFTLLPAVAQTLTFNNNGNGAKLAQSITTASDVITTPITLADNLTVTNTSTLTLGGVISGTSYAITKTGAGTLILTNGNTFGGGLTLGNGTLNALFNTAVGSGDLTLAGGTLEGFGVTVSNNVVAQNGTTTTVQLSGAGDLNLNGNLSGGGTINAQYGAGSGIHTIALGGSNSNFTGTFTAANNNNVRYSFNSTNAGSTNAMWVLNNFGPANNSGIGFGGGAGTYYFGALSGNGGMRGTATLNIGGLNTNATWSGNISANAGTINVVKSGTGTEIFSAANTYSGTTEVRNGTLIVSNALSSSAVTVDAADGAAFLGGTGPISHLVTLTNAGTYTAGINLSNGVAGTLTLSGGLTLNGGTVLSFDVANAGSDQIAVTGAVTLPASGTVTVKLNNIGVTGVGTNKLISVASGSVAMDATKFNLITAAPAGYNWQLQNDADGYSLDLAVTTTGVVTAFWKGGVDNNWSTADSGPNFNWATDATGATSTGAKPGLIAAVIFSVNSVGSANTTLGGNFEIGSLEFNSSGGVTIGGANTLTNDGILKLDAGSGGVTISANGYVLGGDETISNSSSSTLNISSPISGAHALIVNGTGSGTTTLGGNNSYTGSTTVSAGRLVLSGNNTSATGATTVNTNAVLQLQSTNAIAGSALTLNGGGTLNLRADADTTFAAAGIAAIPNSATVTISADQVTSGGGNGSHTLSLTNGFSMGANATVNVTNGSGDTLALGTISIAQGNANTENLSAAAGATASLGGVTASGTYDYFGFSGAGKINVVGALQETAASRWLGLTFNQSGTVTLWAANSLRFNNTGTSGNPAYSPAISFNSGVTVLNNSGALNMNSTFGSIVSLGATSGSSDATVLLGGTDSQGLAGGITMNPPLMVGGASWPYYNGTIYTELGTSGTLTVGGQNTSGTNAWGCSFTLGPANFNDLTQGKSLTLVAATGGEVDFTGNFLANGSDTSAGITVGDATHGGTVKITGVNNTYAGGTTVNGGTLLMNGKLLGAGAVTVNGGTLGGTGGINGATTVNAGGLLAAGNGGIGTLTFSNSLVLNAASTNSFVVTTSGGASNKVVVAGMLSPNGSVIKITSGTALGVGTNTLFTYASTNGTLFNATPVFDVTPVGTATILDDGAGHVNLVVTSASAPLSGLKFTTGPVISGTSLTISATNTGAGTVYLLTSTNVAAPVSTWTPIWTNVLSGSGSFSTNLLNAVNAALNQQFYLLSNTNN